VVNLCNARSPENEDRKPAVAVSVAVKPSARGKDKNRIQEKAMELMTDDMPKEETKKHSRAFSLLARDDPVAIAVVDNCPSAFSSAQKLARVMVVCCATP